jgi:ADP-ribosylglycohydrolase
LACPARNELEELNMLGAIAGDVIGSVHEWTATKVKDFPLFAADSQATDDSILTIAVAEWILTGKNLVDLLHAYAQAYPTAGFGGMFVRWAFERRREPYGSFGNGSAMRVSPVGFAFNTLEEVLDWAERSAAVTHNHPEGIRGAQATAAAIFLARSGSDMQEIRNTIESMFGYDLSRTLADIRPTYQFNETCQETVPQAIIAFLESTDYEDAVRNAISLGGDADTLACITGGIAEAYYGAVPAMIAERVIAVLDDHLRGALFEFRRRCGWPDALMTE